MLHFSKMYFIVFVLMTNTLFSYSQPSDWVDGAGGTISIVQDLLWLSDHPDVWDENWVMGADIDASISSTWNTNTGMDPIGNAATHFTGSFDGQGHTISGVTIDRSANDSIGFFGYTENSSITNFHLTNATITGNKQVGGLIGFAASTYVLNCSVDATVNGGGNVGTLIGEIIIGVIDATKSSGSVTTTTYGYSGGRIGRANYITISRSYSTSDVVGEYWAAGFIGSVIESNVYNNFATGSTTANLYNASGLISNSDYSIVLRNYATGAAAAITTSTKKSGFLGGSISSGSELSENYFDTVTTDTSLAILYEGNAAGIIGKGTADFAIEGTFEHWDFESVWHIDTVLAIDAEFRPYLNVFTKEHYVAVVPSIPGAGVIIGGDSYADGSTVSLKAVPSEGYTFTGWSKHGVTLSTQLNYSFTITSTQTIRAYFELVYAFDGGDGTVGDPYQISSLAQLRTLSNVTALWDKHFVLVKDIDASESATWTNAAGSIVGHLSIGGTHLTTGQDIPFTGSFDGAGHGISDLHIKGLGYSQGLFGYTDGATIKNIGLLNATVIGGSSIGALIGYADNGTTVSQCFVTGSVTGWGSVGGLIGMSDDATIEESYSISTVDGFYTGGLIGYVRNTNITHSYFAGTPTTGNTAGALAGVLRNSSTITTSFVDTLISDTAIAGQVIGSSLGVFRLNTTEFGDDTKFENMDFIDAWQIGTIAQIDGNARPYLQWQLNGFDLEFTVVDHGTIFGATTQKVQKGNNAGSVTARPNEGCYFVQWLDKDGANVTYDTTLVLTNIQASANYTAQFGITYNRVTFYADLQSSITGIDSQHVDYGSDAGSVEATLNEGYEFVAWLDSTGAIFSEQNPVIVSNVKEYTRLYASTQIITSTVTFVAGTNGSVGGIKVQTIDYGLATDSVTAYPAVGFLFDGWYTDGLTLLSSENKFALDSVIYDSTITAQFSIEQHTILIQSESNGTISGDTLQLINHADSGTSVTALASEGYSFTYWKNSVGDSVSIENPFGLDSIINPDTLIARYTINQYVLDYSVASGEGIITVDKAIAHHGDSVTYTVTTAQDFTLDSAQVNGVTVPLDLTVTPGVYTKKVSVKQALLLTIYFSEIPLSSSSYYVSSSITQSSANSSAELISSSVISSSMQGTGEVVSSSSTILTESSTIGIVGLSSSALIAPLYDVNHRKGAVSAQLLNMAYTSENAITIPEQATSYTLYSVHGTVLYRGGVIENATIVLPNKLFQGLVLIKFNE